MKKFDPDNKTGKFYYKSLLIFSGVCVAIFHICIIILGEEFGIADTTVYTICWLIMFGVPFVVHLYTWGLFCDYKNIKVLPTILKVFAVFCAFVSLLMVLLCALGVA